MSLQSAFALGIAALVALPLVAHRLRKREPRSVAFAPIRFVPKVQVPTQRRRALEDKPLFAARAAAVAALALLGATPFAHCDAVTLGRHGGASLAVAVVIDDSASMQAPTAARGETRFAKAQAAAQTLLGELRDGDSAYLISASKPPRLLAGGDVATARDALAHLDAPEGAPRATDAPNDLPAALALAAGLVREAPQVDRRVVLLSDLCDGSQAALPFGETDAPSGGKPAEDQVSYMLPLPELAAPFEDCGILSADLRGDRVVVSTACSRPAVGKNRRVELATARGEVLATAPLIVEEGANAPEVALDGRSAGTTFVVTLPLARANSSEGGLVARLRAGDGAVADGVASNDVAPLLAALSEPVLAVVTAQEERGPSATKPILLQAFAAIEPEGPSPSSVALRPLPSIPDRPEDLAAFKGIVLDDPPGLSPEQRRTLRTFAEAGGVVVLALGPKAARGRLGQTFEPWFSHPLTWGPTGGVSGVGREKTTAKDPVDLRFSVDPSGLDALAPQGRTTFDPDDSKHFSTILRWSDGEPLVATRTVGDGELFVTTLPFSADASDFPLRPAFLNILQGFIAATVGHAAPRRTVAGATWALPSDVISVRGPQSADGQGPLLELLEEGRVRSASPRFIGAYTVTTRPGRCTQKECEREERRVVAPAAEEIGPAPRPLPKGVAPTGHEGARVETDVSWVVALVVLGLVALELGLRLLTGRPSTDDALTGTNVSKPLVKS